MCEKCFDILEKFSKSMMKRNKGPMLKVSVPKSVQTGLLQAYTKSKTTYRKDMHSNMATYLKGGMSKADFLKVSRESIRTAYFDSFTLGKQFSLGASATMSSDERKSVAFMAAEEMKFMSKFADDIANSAGKMPYDRRMQMYIDGLDSVFGFGRIAFLPDEIKIIWKLGVTDKHCIDCLSYAANNPYTKKTLPGLPKSGSSTCLSNCLCSISYYLGGDKTTSAYESFIISKSVGPRVPTEMEYANLMAMREEYYYNSLMHERTKDPTHSDAAKTAYAQYFSYQKKRGFEINDTLPIGPVLTDFRNMNKNKYFDFIDPNKTKSVTQNAFVGVFVGDHFQYGRVRDVVGNHLRVKVFGTEDVLLEIGKSIIFTER
jgi:hypothetical protein